MSRVSSARPISKTTCFRFTRCSQRGISALAASIVHSQARAGKVVGTTALKRNVGCIYSFMKKAVIVSGYFNPIHKGHLAYFNNAKALADELIVIVNNDRQRELKGSKVFQDEEERIIIVSNIKAVDHVFLSIDEDRTVCKTLEKIYEEYRENYELVFANGGDQNNVTIPELTICSKLGIELIDGLGDKIQSSSWLLK